MPITEEMTVDERRKYLKLMKLRYHAVYHADKKRWEEKHLNIKKLRRKSCESVHSYVTLKTGSE